MATSGTGTNKIGFIDDVTCDRTVKCTELYSAQIQPDAIKLIDKKILA